MACAFNFIRCDLADGLVSTFQGLNGIKQLR
jgi:hypothetical protein